MKIIISVTKRNPIAKDLRTPKYRMRVVTRKNTYRRKLKHVKGNDAVLV